MVTAPGADETVTRSGPGTSGSGVVWAVIAVAVLAAAVVTPLVLRRRSGAELTGRDGAGPDVTGRVR
jgi:hypothetical protein